MCGKNETAYIFSVERSVAEIQFSKISDLKLNFVRCAHAVIGNRFVIGVKWWSCRNIILKRIDFICPAAITTVVVVMSVYLKIYILIKFKKCDFLITNKKK